MSDLKQLIEKQNEKILAIGNEVAGLYNATCYKFNNKENKQEVTFMCEKDAGEKFVTSLTYDKIKKDYAFLIKSEEALRQDAEKTENTPAMQMKTKQQEEMDELNEKLLSGVKAMFNSENFKNYLDFCAKCPTRSLNNQILILMQKPEATLTLGYKQWQERFERTVNKGEKGITILAPNTHTFYTTIKTQEQIDNLELAGTISKEDAEKMSAELSEKGKTIYKSKSVCSFRPVKVFDVSQTEGKELPNIEICKLLDGDLENYEKIKDTFVSIAQSKGVSVEFADDTDSHLKSNSDIRGYYSSVEDKIVVRSSLPETQKISTLVHELAHSLMHGEIMRVEGVETTQKPFKDIRELQAEAVSYMVCQKMGIETSEKTFGYIAGYINTGNIDKNIDIMKDNLSIINKCASFVIKEMEKTLSVEISKEEVNEKEIKPLAPVDDNIGTSLDGFEEDEIVSFYILENSNVLDALSDRLSLEDFHFSIEDDTLKVYIEESDDIKDIMDDMSIDYQDEYTRADDEYDEYDKMNEEYEY